MTRSTIAITIVAMFFTSSTAIAADDDCAKAKIGGAGKAAKSAIACNIKLLADPLFDVGECEDKSAEKLLTGFTKADLKGPCDGTPSACAHVSESCAEDVATAALLSTNATCEARLMKAAGTYAKKLLQCNSSFYAGKTQGDVDACEATAESKLATAFGKIEAKYGSCAPVTATTLADAVEAGCRDGVVPVLSDTARLCKLCLETRELGAPRGCSDGDADLIAKGEDDAEYTFSALTDYSFELGPSTNTYCNFGTGTCDTSPPIGTSEGCCAITLTPEVGPPVGGCSMGPTTIEGIFSCADFGGSVVLGAACVNGQSCQ